MIYRHSVFAIALLFVAVPPAIADGGLTAVGRVRPVAAGPTVSAALSSGYGFTGDVLGVDDSHHRASGAIGVAVRAQPWLELSARLAGRYDRTTGGASDSGLVGDPHLAVTAGGRVGRGGDALGFRLGVWLPGADAPSLEPGATTVDAAAIYTRSAGAIAVTATAGFRLDNSTKSVEAATLSPADRVGLGWSDANAVLVGLGVRHGDATQIFGEASAELLVGAGAPDTLTSPMRVGVGVRRALDRSLTLEGLVEVGVSQRPDLAMMPADQMVAIEPRLAVGVGLSWRPAPPAPPPIVAPPPPPPPDDVTPPPPPLPTTGPLTGKVVDESGSPLPDVALAVGATTVLSGEDGTFTLPDLPVGDVEVAATRGGYHPYAGKATIVGGTGATVAITLVRLPPKSQIQAVVRDLGGRGVVAKIRIDPLGIDGESDASGNYTIDVPPGTYTVTVSAKGFQTQKKTAVVVEGGVPILNIELQKGRP